MEDNKNVDEIINSIKKRDRSTPSASIYWYVLGVVSVIALSVLSYKYINSKFSGIEEKYNMMSSEITKEIKELKDINENRINEMDKVLSEADSGLKKEIKQLWTSAYKKNRDSMKRLENEFVEHKNELIDHKKDQGQKINSISERIVGLVNKEKHTVKEIESIQSDSKQLESNIKDNLTEIKKMEFSINKSLDETRVYSDNRIDKSVSMIEEKLRAYTLEILNIKDELNQQKDEMLKIKAGNTKLQKENAELGTELQHIKDGSIVLAPDKAVSTNGEQ